MLKTGRNTSQRGIIFSQC